MRCGVMFVLHDIISEKTVFEDFETVREPCNSATLTVGHPDSGQPRHGLNRTGE